ncbi:jg25415, partial [Pararge aegeria aegeria]
MHNPYTNTTENATVGPLGVYEKLDIEAKQLIEMSYTLHGSDSSCENVTFNGHFHLLEKKANSYFITDKSVYSFIDNNNKAIDGVSVSKAFNETGNNDSLLILFFQPTYGTPVTSGLAQLRVYNGQNCNFALNMHNPYTNTTENATVGPLGVYEKLDIEAKQLIEMSYTLHGSDSSCENVTFNGHFHLLEKKANSYFITDKSVYSFIDNNNKAIDGVSV